MQQDIPPARVLAQPAAPAAPAEPAPAPTSEPPGFSAARRAVPARGLPLFVAITAALLASKFCGAC